MPTSRASRSVLALAALALTGCGGDSPAEPDDMDPRVVKANPSFQADIQEIFERKGCSASTCHGESQRAGLDLRSGTSYDALVGVTATTESVVRVIPGDAEGSYLVVRVEGRQAVGNRMPLGGTPLDSIDVANLRNWIERGAARN